MLDCQIFGLNAGGHLLVNALIHACNTLLLFLFLRRTTGARWQSAIVAALFALHPLHVESVAWAAERKDTLSTFFGLLTLLAYARYVETPSWKRYALVAVALALGLMAKPMLVTWPFVLLLLDYWPLRRYQWRRGTGTAGFFRALVPLVREKLPLFCLAAASDGHYVRRAVARRSSPHISYRCPFRYAWLTRSFPTQNIFSRLCGRATWPCIIRSLVRVCRRGNFCARLCC